MVSKCFKTHVPRGWFKGADTVCILEFLESRIGGDLIAMSESRKPIFLEIHATISAANAFMRCMYRAGLWLSHEERDFLLKAGTRCVNSFLRCALRAFIASATRWKFMPKFQSFWRMVIHHGETETPWATKPQFTDVFLPNGRGLRRAN